MNIGVMMAGGNGKNPDKNFRPTPPEAVLALLKETNEFIGPVVHEPACGDGAMAKVIQGEGYYVIATDLVDRGYGISGINFLTSPIRSSSVITNPPFNLALEFIERGCSQNPEYFALLLKQTFWNAKVRLPLYHRFPPRMILPLTWRLDFDNKGAPTMDCMWCVWGSKLPDKTVFKPLPKP